MNTPKSQVTDFLKRHGLFSGDIDPEETLLTLCDEMEAGLAGQESSLAMIPTYIECERSVPHDEPVIVIDAGGTNLRVGTVTFQAHGQYTLDDFSKYPMPGLERELTAQEFYTILAEYLTPMLHKSKKIGFCFSYPSEISSDKDGKLIHWTKGVSVPELIGQFVGAGLLKELATRGHEGMSLVLLNDTVASLLAGKLVGEERQCESYVGFILGTGTNTAYLEKHQNIKTCTGLSPEGSMAINLESGGFAKGPFGTLDKAFFQGTDSPGRMYFEKMISGAYLGPLALQVLHQAADDHLFSAAATTVLKELTALSTIEVSQFAANPFDDSLPFSAEAISETDRETISRILTGLIDRAALLTAVNISATVIKCGAGHNPLHPVCINIDGSTFYKTHGLESKVRAHLASILGERGIFYETVEVDNGPIIGAAVAGLTG